MYTVNVKGISAYKLSVIASLLLSLYPSASYSVSDTELNTVFLQGTQFVPSIFKKGVRFPAGEYYVDVIVNDSNVGKSKLNISPEEKEPVSCVFHQSGWPTQVS